jgi:hypothetical protein
MSGSWPQQHLVRLLTLAFDAVHREAGLADPEVRTAMNALWRDLANLFDHDVTWTGPLPRTGTELDTVLRACLAEAAEQVDEHIQELLVYLVTLYVQLALRIEEQAPSLDMRAVLRDAALRAGGGEPADAEAAPE